MHTMPENTKQYFLKERCPKVDYKSTASYNDS